MGFFLALTVFRFPFFRSSHLDSSLKVIGLAYLRSVRINVARDHRVGSSDLLTLVEGCDLKRDKMGQKGAKS